MRCESIALKETEEAHSWSSSSCKPTYLCRTKKKVRLQTVKALKVKRGYKSRRYSNGGSLSSTCLQALQRDRGRIEAIRMPPKVNRYPGFSTSSRVFFFFFFFPLFLLLMYSFSSFCRCTLSSSERRRWSTCCRSLSSDDRLWKMVHGMACFRQTETGARLVTVVERQLN